MKNALVILVVVMALVSIHAIGETRPDKVIIAHRGASGYLPEHTLAAYAMAYAQGADYLEPDLAMTSDGVLVCIHDMTLDATTNVVEVFPDRKRNDGKYYVVDFTLEEIKTLLVRERYNGRFPKDTLLFQIPTLEEMIQLAQGLNASTGRDVGIYPELKDSGIYERAGLPFAETLLEMLDRYGYKGPDANVYIQCFIPAVLIRLRQELNCTLPLIQLVSDKGMQDDLVSEEGLKKVAEYAQGIGPHKSRVENDPGLVTRAHAVGLKVHPYTIRADMTPPRYGSAEEELRVYLFEYGVDGFFVDHPDVMYRVRESKK